ncbi:MAG: imidazole glycerol phosphate synthase subunit HisH [Candidatus Promineifilaceae bacterium]|nr:imidazole glycerol phosphate synthase subunit HisH [Candidatus Promineifilaceae bacterium]
MSNHNKVVMIDYGAGNIRSVQKAFEYVGTQVKLVNEPQPILSADKLVLPGVGAFGAGIKAIRERGLDTAVVNKARSGTPLLGICLGMQFLFDQSDEMGFHRGLGLIPGKVTRFDLADMGLKVPHMGWNQISMNYQHALTTGVPDNSHAYFVHSYYCIPEDENDILAQTEFGHSFASCVAHDNILGIQFHPEKSQRYGLQILQNFVAL